MSPHVEREDLRQQYELERAKAAHDGRKPRPRQWVETDLYRKESGIRGQKNAAQMSTADMDRIAAIEPQKAERQSTLIERAVRVALGLPDAQRRPILAALRFLAPLKVEDRIKAWLEMNPDRIVFHRQIAAETGVARESVTKAISKLRKRRQLNA